MPGSTERSRSCRRSPEVRSSTRRRHETDYAQVDVDAFDRKVAPLVRHVADTALFWGPATNRYVISLLVASDLGVLGLVAGVVMLIATGLGTATVALLVAAAALIVLSLWLFGRGSIVVDRALAKTHFHSDGSPTKLRAVRRSVNHLFCATELQGGGHFYLAPVHAALQALERVPEVVTSHELPPDADVSAFPVLRDPEEKP
jgi:hypothetical protein